MLSFMEFTLKDMKLRNRLVMPPMCMYSSDSTGQVMDFHRAHYSARSLGGVGLIILEATAVEPVGRITDQDLGIWDDSQTTGLAEVVRLIHSGGATAGIQLAHAGRKSKSAAGESVGPSAIFFNADYRIPHELTTGEIKQTVKLFQAAASRALLAGFDTIELHGAHGYLIHEFLSPLANQRTDEYGGSLENRVRFLQEILAAIKAVWPENKPVLLRLSASDYLPGGLDLDETVRIVNLVKDDVDLFHISSGGIMGSPVHTFPGYQLRFSEAVKGLCQVPTIAVGLITELAQVEEILGNQRADLVALGRELLRNPFWPIRQSLVNKNADCPVPIQYRRAWL